MSANILESLEGTLSCACKDVQSKIWIGDFFKDPHSKALRGLCWRMMLGVIKSSGVGGWATDLLSSVDDYTSLKGKVMPKIENVAVDPLTGLADDQESSEWKQYYAVNLIVPQSTHRNTLHLLV